MIGDQRVALISGGNGGIGRAAIDALRLQGFLTVSLQLTTEGSSADLTVLGDVRIEEDCRQAVASLAERYGRLDALVNCAGVNSWAPFEETSEGAAKELFEINLWGTVRLLRLSSDLLHASRGSVVTITSTAGELGIPNTSIYGMSKAALDSLTRTLAVEWGPAGIRVNSIAATIVRTPMNEAARQDAALVARKVGAIPIGRIIEPEEVAAAIAFLCGPASSAVTGTTLRVDGGTVIKGV